MKRTLMFVLLWMIVSIPVAAQTEAPEPTEEPTPTVDQGSCPTLVKDALELTKSSCEQVGDNQVCYGHSELQAASRPGFTDFKFDEPGDVEDVIQMQSLSLSPMDTVREIWGVLLMNVQAQVEESTQGNVTFVVFGDTELNSPSTLIEAGATGNANLRALPNASSEIVGVIAEGDRFTVNGRSEDGQWLRIRFINEQGGVQLGWLSVSLAQTDGDLATLDTISPDELTQESPLQYGPMQAFYFRSGDNDAPCEAAPNSGMLIQTPEGQASVTLWIDEVIIELDGTTYVKAAANGDLVAYSLDGNVTVTAGGETRTAVEGTQISVPLNENLVADGAPSEPEAYNLEDLQSLPTDLLTDPVEIADPLTVVEGAPAAGNWSFSWLEASMTCPDGSVWTFESGAPSALTVAADGSSITHGGTTYSLSGTGVYGHSYVDSDGNLHQQTLTVNGIDRITGQDVIDLGVTPCTLTVPFTMQLVSR